MVFLISHTQTKLFPFRNTNKHKKQKTKMSAGFAAEPFNGLTGLAGELKIKICRDDLYNNFYFYFRNYCYLGFVYSIAAHLVLKRMNNPGEFSNVELCDL